MADTAPRPAAPAADSFLRDPHKLVAYIVPFPPPREGMAGTTPPIRFLVYTPPPPPLLKPTGRWESPAAMVQRHWQEEVRAAHARPSRSRAGSTGALGAALAVYSDVRAAVTRTVEYAMHSTTSAELDFLTRVPRDGEMAHGECEHEEAHSAVALDEIVLIYPPLLKLTPEEMRGEFVASLLRTQSRAQRDAVVATGLLPVTAALDWALVFVGWVFGGALEIDAVWAAASIRGARTASSVVRRLKEAEGELKLTFVPSDRAQVLADYLLGRCVERDPKRWEVGWRGTPVAGDVLDVIGWNAARGERRARTESVSTSEGAGAENGHEGNGDGIEGGGDGEPQDGPHRDASSTTRLGAEAYQDQNADGWERAAVERDLDRTMSKAAKAYDKWLTLWMKNPEKAVRR